MLEKIKQFVIENQKPIIQIGGAMIGAIVGVGITALIMSSSDEILTDFVEEE